MSNLRNIKREMSEKLGIPYKEISDRGARRWDEERRNPRNGSCRSPNGTRAGGGGKRLSGKIDPRAYTRRSGGR